MNDRAVIIGAGPGGLAAAMLLANRGIDVTVLERQPFVGGRTSALEADGFRFDRGPTFFLYPRILDEVFAAVGRNLRDEVEIRKLDPQYRLIYGDGSELLATPNVEQMQAEIARLSPADAQQLPRFLADTREKFARFAPILQRPFLRWRDLLAPDLIKLLPWVAPWRSLDGELARYFRDPRVRLAFTFQGKYLGMSPMRCPSLFSILSYLEYDHGVFHPIGGCAAVSEAMARIAAEMGVDIRLNEPVESLEFRGRRVVAARTALNSYPADALIINADFARAMTRLVPDHLRSRWSDRRIQTKRFSCSTFMLYLGLEGCDDIPHHTIYLPRDYAGVLADIEHRHELSADPALYVQNASVTDPTLAPPGHSTLYVLVPVTHQHPHVDWSRERPAFRERVLDHLQRVGVRDVRRRIRYEQVMTPADWDTDFEIHRGATFNLAHNLGQMLHLRPRNRFEELDGVYLVGGGTHPGSGLPVIYESARITSRLVLDDLGMSSGWLDNPVTEPQRESISIR